MDQIGIGAAAGRKQPNYRAEKATDRAKEGATYATHRAGEEAQKAKHRAKEDL